jgi:hypothetical protein
MPMMHRYNSIAAAVFEYGGEYRVIIDDAVIGSYKSKELALDMLILELDYVEAL